MGNRLDRPRGLAHRSPGLQHPAHQQRRSPSSACWTWAWTCSNFADACSVLAQRLAKRQQQVQEGLPPEEAEIRHLLGTSIAKTSMQTKPSKTPSGPGSRSLTAGGSATGTRAIHALPAGRLRALHRGYKGLGLHELMIGLDPVEGADPGSAPGSPTCACDAFEEGMRVYP